MAGKLDKEVQGSSPVWYTSLESPGPALNSVSSGSSPADLVQSNTECSLILAESQMPHYFSEDVSQYSINCIPPLSPTRSSTGFFLQCCQTWAFFSPFYTGTHPPYHCSYQHTEKERAFKYLYHCSTYSCLDHYYVFLAATTARSPQTELHGARCCRNRTKDQTWPQDFCCLNKDNTCKNIWQLLNLVFPWHSPFLLILLQMQQWIFHRVKQFLLKHVCNCFVISCWILASVSGTTKRYICIF